MHQELRVAGLFLRRKSDKEFHQYSDRLAYDPADYEVFLRPWPSEPFKTFLSAFSGPAIPGEAPEETILRESQKWTAKLAGDTVGWEESGMRGRRAMFLSVHGGGGAGRSSSIGVFVGYVVPVTNTESLVVSKYPNSPHYPKFYQLDTILRGMIGNEVKVHPVTREMLSSLDHWLREQHAIPGALTALFAPTLVGRIKMSVVNPLLDEVDEFSTPNHSFRRDVPNPLLSSTPHHGLHDDEDDFEFQPVDIVIKNPVFGSGLDLQKVNAVVVNKHFGCGPPDYDALGQRKGKWMVQVNGDGLPDWTEMFPIHKFACEGDGEGISRCLQLGIDPDELDTDSWAPLHYACWYGEVEAVQVLVEEGTANLAIQNSAGSTPLHLAAETGHTEVVEYLLRQRGMSRVKAALDNDGKSPLAVCLEFKMNDWKKTAELLREAYKCGDNLPLSPPPLNSRAASIDHLLAAVHLAQSRDHLRWRGSQADVTTDQTPQIDNKRKKRDGNRGQRSSQTVRRQRVNLMSGQHSVVHFFRGRDTPAGDVIRDLYRLIGLSKDYHGLFALWISSHQLELQIGDTDKPLKLMSSWKQLVTQYSSNRASHSKSSSDDVPNFCLHRNVFFPLSKEKLVNDPLALKLLYSDAQSRVLSGYYPCTEDVAICLAGISMQINYGDHNPSVHQTGFLREKLKEVLPAHFIKGKRRLELERKVLTEHAQTNQDEVELLYVNYLKQCWDWPYYGATFFSGNLHTKSAKLNAKVKGKLGRKSWLPVKIGVNTKGFHFINSEANEMIESFNFSSVEWDMSSEKRQVEIYRKDRSLYILIDSKKASLVYSLVTRIEEQQCGIGMEGSRTATNIYAT